jgi:hypothetical protein
MANLNQIKFNGWEVVAASSIFEHHTIIEMGTIFISNGDDHFYLYDEVEKMIDVTKMPNYISEDWVNYNKKELNIKILDKHIKEFLEIGQTDAEFIANELKSIKRDLILRKLI